MNELVSVIIPIFNVESYLKRCVESIIHQTYENLEIILVDDGSLDNCPQMCEDFAAKDGRIRVIHKANGGLSDARNAGIDVAKGEYLIFIDSDDYVDIKLIEALYQAATVYSADISVCRRYRIDENDQILHISDAWENNILTNIETLELIFKVGGPIVGAWGKLYKKELFRDIRFPKGKIHEDEATTPKLYFYSRKVAFCNDILYYYVQHNNQSIMRRKISIKRLDYIDALTERIEFYKNHKLYGFSERTTESLFYFFVKMIKTEPNKIENVREFYYVLKRRYFENLCVFLSCKKFSLPLKLIVFLSRFKLTIIKICK